MNKKLFPWVLVLLLGGGAAFSLDSGLTVRFLPVLNAGSRGQFDFNGGATPWFAAPLGEKGDLYLSGGLSAAYSLGYETEWKPVFELHRFEIEYRCDSGPLLRAGRIPCGEPLNILMNGLFDGFALGLDLGKTRLSAGAFYTGLLYKKTAYIVMSPGDYEKYYDRGRYFSSRRMVLCLGWEIPAPGSGAVFDLGITGQFDLNKKDPRISGDGKIHSQYALAGCTLPFLNYFNARLGALLGIIEEEKSNPGFCFAFSGDLAWLPPGGADDRLSLNTVFSSGAWGRGLRAFLPINTIAQGKVLRPNISGLCLAEGEYTIRLHPSLSAEFSAAYFFRTDARTYGDSGLDGASRSPLLGGEIYGGFTLAPASDISFTLGGGAFFPRWGKAFAADAAPRGRVSVEMILSF